jgi:two-component system, NarL family, nitrate/nitrite response regulator NarL
MLDSATKPIRILLVDDHALFRQSVARFLTSEPGFEVTAHCDSIEEGLAILQKTHIDIVLLDFDLGQHDGGEFMRLARQQGFKGKVLVVTAGVEKDQVAELVRNGISGIFMKHDSAELLVEGIHDVLAGRVWFARELLHDAIGGTVAHQETKPSRFTERERQVLSCVFKGLVNKEIAEQLGVSESSVKSTLQQLFSKTGVRTRSQLVRITLEQHRNQI